MNVFARAVAVVLLGSGAALVAQDVVIAAPPVLVIQREFLKPGKSGAMHERSESAFVAAFTAAKWPTYYIAATSMSGRPRALFLMGYPTFEAWEKDNRAIEKNATLSAAIDRAGVADGELQTEFAQTVFALDKEHSLLRGDAVHARYFEIQQFHIKPGHGAEFMELAKIYKDTYEKVSPLANWALYSAAYGENSGGYYVAISLTKTLAEDDQSMDDDAKFAKAVGEPMMKKVRELTAACTESTQSNLFAFSPKMSYASPEWVKADEFWKAKAAAMKKPATATPTP